MSAGHVQTLGDGWTAEAIRPAPSDPWTKTEHAADPADATAWQVRDPDGEVVGESLDLPYEAHPKLGPQREEDLGEGWTLKSSVGEMSPAERDAAADAYARAERAGLVPPGVDRDEFVSLVNVAVNDPEADWTTDARMQEAAKRRMEAERKPEPTPGALPSYEPS